MVRERRVQRGRGDVGGLLVRAGETEPLPLADERAGAGVGVADQEEGVGLPLYEEVVAQGRVVMGGGPLEPPERGVASETVHEGPGGGAGGDGADLGAPLGPVSQAGPDAEILPAGVGLLGAADDHLTALGTQEARDALREDGGPDLAGVVEAVEAPGLGGDPPVAESPFLDLADAGGACLGAGGGVEREVQEARPGDLDPSDPGRTGHPVPQQGGDLPRRQRGGPPAGGRRRRRSRPCRRAVSARPARAREPARAGRPRRPRGAQRAARSWRDLRGSRHQRMGGRGRFANRFRHTGSYPLGHGFSRPC